MGHQLFEEKQQFRQIWLWILLTCISLVLLVQVPITLINSSGEGPMPVSSIVALLLSMGITIGLIILMYSLTLRTKISKDAVEITFRPFINRPKLFFWNDIEKAFVRKYKPVWEYGGWGIRIRWHGRAYNTSGNMGLQLIMKSGKKILIGTQKVDELKEYLQKYIYPEQIEY